MRGCIALTILALVILAPAATFDLLAALWDLGSEIVYIATRLLEAIADALRALRLASG